MTDHLPDLLPRTTARIAGFLYLMYIATSVVADLFGHFAFGDAATIVSTIVAHPALFRSGLVIGLLSSAFFLLAAWALYALLKPVNKILSLLFLLLNAVGVAIQCLSMLGLFASLLLQSGAGYGNAFPADQLRAQTTLYIDLYKSGNVIAQVFLGTWVLPLGYLVFKSGFLPRFLGILLMIDCLAILTWFFQFFLFPAYPAIAYPCWVISAIAEFSLTLWLLIVGVKDKKAAAQPR
jgi:hypothetical protein